jgi:hopene-associated glycosyltransferase HpnB
LSGWLGWALVAPGALVWSGIVLPPWRAWSTRESLDVLPGPPHDNEPGADLGDVTVLIPARDEAAVIARTVRALTQQGAGLKVVLVDDQSSDGTAEIACEAASGLVRLDLRSGAPLPSGWAGKLWALEQARQHADTPLVLLLDADIELRPGLIVQLRSKLLREGLGYVSLMAQLSMANFWERLLIPAFIYFFKLLYPFALSNLPRERAGSGLIAAGAGGCVLVRRAVLDEVGAFASLRDALIDDCTLARKIKDRGHRTWIGLTHSAVSLRAEQGFASIHQMVARSAFTQLRYSLSLLLAVTGVFAAAFWAPVWLVVCAPEPVAIAAAAMLTAMMLSYIPTLRYYGRSPAWALAMPLIATLYLGMTWSSAIRYWRGVRSRWKGRTYQTVDWVADSSEGGINR